MEPGRIEDGGTCPGSELYAVGGCWSAGGESRLDGTGKEKLIGQIMDPKMDSGLMEQDAADNYEVLAPRLPEEIIGILDQLLSHEVLTPPDTEVD